MERRKFFLRSMAAAGIAAPAATAQQSVAPALAQGANSAAVIPRVSDPGELRGEMLYRKFGSTGETVLAIGMGGSHIAKPA